MNQSDSNFILKAFQYKFPCGRICINFKGLIRVFLMSLRGLICSVRMKRIVFLGKESYFSEVNYIKGKGILKVEEGCLIQGISSKSVVLGNQVSFGAYTQLRPSSLYGGEVGEGCVIEDGSSFGPFSYIGCAGMIKIGKRCMFGPRVSIIAENHKIPSRASSIKDAGVIRKGIVIGNDCWIGSNAVILDGSRIGDGVVIGAGSIVRGKIPSFSIAVGVPAKVIRER